MYILRSTPNVNAWNASFVSLRTVVATRPDSSDWPQQRAIVLSETNRIQSNSIESNGLTDERMKTSSSSSSCSSSSTTTSSIEDAYNNLRRRTREHGLPYKIRRIRIERGLTDLLPYVLRKEPVILTNIVSTWPCAKKWNKTYLENTIGTDTQVSVNFTPNGLGDAVEEDVFVLPEERIIKFGEFVSGLEKTSDGTDDDDDDKSVNQEVMYLSHQNDSLRTQFPMLRKDVPEQAVPWAEDIFGELDAVNLWIGHSNARSSLHKDHYENMYAVVRGEKIFTLFAPSDVPFLYEACEFPVSQYVRNPKTDRFDAVPKLNADGTRMHTQWIPIDVRRPNLQRYPKFAMASSITCRVRAGEMLYLPSMWYHHVEQADWTVAVNYWYDMVFGFDYIYHSFVQDMTSALKGKEDDESSSST